MTPAVFAAIVGSRSCVLTVDLYGPVPDADFFQPDYKQLCWALVAAAMLRKVAEPAGWPYH